MAHKFDINIDPSRLEDLQKRLDLAKFPDELEGAGWDYGAPLSDVKRLTAYWRTRFDWKKVEAQLNELPNYRTTVQVKGFGGVDVHFLHQKSSAKKAVPLLFCHGWV